ncbi:hypothetical protein ElyMa_002333300 [Elysia marginata]|uniref:G-protein coupled receptors family 1 profile domain-containing protein n=1 Tax=Elysia marginata TaxID=1093978 RepID=A0AAV4G6S7_9GAST|nr:hypothetical protein ElyMa_002333300 [Elysia marginata]
MSPLVYDLKMTRLRMRLLLLVVWLSALLLASASFVYSHKADSAEVQSLELWNKWSQRNHSVNATLSPVLQPLTDDKMCRLAPPPEYSLVLVVITLFLPFSIVVALYTRIYRVVLDQLTAIRISQTLASVERAKSRS